MAQHSSASQASQARPTGGVMSENKYKDRAGILNGLVGGYGLAQDSLNKKLSGKTGEEAEMLKQELARVSVLMSKCSSLAKLEEQQKSEQIFGSVAREESKAVAEKGNDSVTVEIEKKVAAALTKARGVKGLGFEPEISIDVDKNNNVTVSVEARMADGSHKDPFKMSPESLAAERVANSPVAEKPNANPKPVSGKWVEFVSSTKSQSALERN